ncbi:MAG: DUF3298 domain-containing protein [Bacteroidota bacterium]
MKKYILAFLVILVTATPGKTQTLPVKQFCRHYEGAIHKDIKLTVNLVRVNDSLYGDYTVGGPAEQNGRSSTPHTRLLSGKMNPNGSFRVREYPGEHGPVINGHFTDDQHITGIILNKSGSGKGLPFRLEENYPVGMTRFNLNYEEDKIKLTGNAGSPKAVVKLSLLLPAGTTPADDSLRKFILRKFTGRPTMAGKPETLLAGIRQDYFREYVTSNKTLYEEMPGASFEWELLRYTRIVYNGNHRVTFSISSYSFTGGAHGNETQSFTTVDMKSGKILSMTDLFKPGYDEELTRLLTSKLHKANNLDESRKLVDAGYFTDEIKPSANFYLDENGIGFCYNQYEIAPHSFGSTDIFLTCAELKGILKQPL